MHWISLGVAVLLAAAIIAWGALREVGIILAVEALIPVGDMLTILAAKGSTRAALGMHGVTALVMILAAIPLILGVH